MMDFIIKDYGWCQILKRNNDYIIRYDTGGIAVKMIEAPITLDEATRASANDLEAERLIIELEKKK